MITCIKIVGSLILFDITALDIMTRCNGLRIALVNLCIQSIRLRMD
jgi:hypothetical protein